MQGFDSQPRGSRISDKVVSHQQKYTQRNKGQCQRVKQDIYPDFFIFYSFNFFEKDNDSDDNADQEADKMKFISIR